MCWLGAQAEDNIFPKGPQRLRGEADWGPEGDSGAMEHKLPDPGSALEPARWK